MFRCLTEGNSIRATARLCDVAFNTVLTFSVKIGRACLRYQSEHLRNLKCQRLEVDELHSFVGSRDCNSTPERRKANHWGTTWVVYGIDPVSKLIPAWQVGKRDAMALQGFLYDLKERLAGRTQISTDGHGPYISAMETVFGAEVDYAQLVKVFSKDNQDSAYRYAPPRCIGLYKTPVSGKPNLAKVGTSIIERANLSLRMRNRRFTRLTNGYSKRVENHYLSLAVTFMDYNYCRIHKTLRCTPAMEAGLTDHVWEASEVIGLLCSMDKNKIAGCS